MNTKSKIDSINFKTLCYFISFATLILIFLWLIQIIFLKFSYERYQINNINKISKNIYKYSEEKLLKKIEDIAYDNNYCIEYITSDNNYSYNLQMPTCLLAKNNSLIKEYKYRLVSDKNNISTLKITNSEFKVRGLLSSITKDEAVVFIYTNLEDVSATSKVLSSQLIYITFIAIILSFFLAYYISRRLTKPIEEITKKAKDLGSKNIVFNKSGIREIDDLADTLNYANKEISKIDELRRDLMANVSHDLKTPLTMIKAYAEMIKDFSYKDDDKRNQHLDIIMDEADRLNVLVNDILLLSKTQAEAEELKIEEYDIVKEIKNIIKKYEIIKETENYNIIYEGLDKAAIKADKNKMNQVVYNLINNAINYTGEDKTVKIKVSEVSKRYKVEISDSGKGIKKEDLKHIWDKYYKNEKNHQRNVVGTGLGLSIVKSILVNHNFKYGVESKVKKGTTFYFEIKK